MHTKGSLQTSHLCQKSNKFRIRFLNNLCNFKVQHIIKNTRPTYWDNELSNFRKMKVPTKEYYVTLFALNLSILYTNTICILHYIMVSTAYSFLSSMNCSRNHESISRECSIKTNHEGIEVRIMSFST